MQDTPQTRSRLPMRVGHETDVNGWREFVRLYGPVIYGFGRKRGLRDAAAAELMRTVLQGIANNLETSDHNPRNGTTNSWLYSATCDTIGHFLPIGKNGPRGIGGCGPRVGTAPDRGTEPDSDWDAEYRRQLAVRAMDRVKHEFQSLTWQAFWKSTVGDEPASAVGSELGMTPGAVHVARSRVLARLHEEMRRLEQHGTANEGW